MRFFCDNHKKFHNINFFMKLHKLKCHVTWKFIYKIISILAFLVYIQSQGRTMKNTFIGEKIVGWYCWWHGTVTVFFFNSSWGREIDESGFCRSFNYKVLGLSDGIDRLMEKLVKLLLGRLSFCKFYLNEHEISLFEKHLVRLLTLEPQKK